MGIVGRSLISRACSLALVGVVVLPMPTMAQMGPASHFGQTPTYAVELTIGPAEQMVSPGDAMTAKSGEVMVSGGSMAPSGSMGNGSSMAAPSSMQTSVMMMTPSMDQGMTVNHHLEVRLTRNDSGAVVNDVTPTIRIMDKATGESRDLPQVMAMYGVQTGLSDFHYGQNVWLPDGTYSVTVMVGPETSVFRDLAVMSGAPMPMSMSGG